LVAYRVARRTVAHGPPPVPEAWGRRHMERVVKELKLTPEQTERIQPIIKRNIEELTKLRRQSMRASHDIVERMEAEITAVLTPEQRTQYERILKERREMRKQMQERGGRPDRERPPGPPPGPAPGERPLPPPSGG
jgi:Spy/CpxP family protein refolding chaperone